MLNYFQMKSLLSLIYNGFDVSHRFSSIVNKLQSCNNIIKISRKMLLAQHSGYKTHNRAKTTIMPVDIYPENLHREGTTNHAKQILSSNPSNEKRQLRPQTAGKSTGNKISNSPKKQSIYRKLLNKSIDNRQIQQNQTTYKKAFENTKKTEMSNQAPFVFRQILEKEQQKKFSQKIYGKLEKMMNSNTKEKKQNQPQVKSFQCFIQTKKKKDKRTLNASDTKYKSIQKYWQKQTISQTDLTIQGNQKHLKNKQILSVSNRSKARKLFRGLSFDKDKETINPQSQFIKGCKYQLKKFKRQQSPINTIDIQQSKTQQQKKSIIKQSYCFKNLYSPFNGIQIKYLSTDNPDIFPITTGFNEASSKKIVLQTYPYPHNRITKSKDPKDNTTKGSIFRKKHPPNHAQKILIQGWKVSQLQIDDHFDLYPQV